MLARWFSWSKDKGEGSNQSKESGTARVGGKRERPSLFNVDTKVVVDDQERGGVHIQFHETLVQELKDDHKFLVGIVTEIYGDLESKKYTQVKGKIRDLKFELNRHVLAENHRLYTYLHQSSIENVHLGEDDTSTKEVKREMAEIMHAVNKFLKHVASDEFQLNSDTAPSFKDKFDKIVKRLSQRIKMEESYLYPLYQDYGKGKL